jgi:anti-sigma regulatory factor (Ser/Thr protein kinase)
MEIIIQETANGDKYEMVIIDRGHGEFTSMTKAHYEELEAAKIEPKATSKK